ncbi:Holliday junction branch migration protein RuvA [Candidatus Gracilibacteria bacterium]|nr:MAG: Holliday junction branch migration protein RuvA [Candidatus Gracilibacteria bacterium]
MISYIKGKIIELDFNSVTILTASGLGYELGINELIYSDLALQEETELFVYHHKTENSEMLFGFKEKFEKKIFTELIKISGVGGKIAMQILSLSAEKLIYSAKTGDNKTIESIKGVGKKMAEKIILEFKDKDFGFEIKVQENTETKNIFIEQDLLNSIKSTLVNMGYDKNDVEKILQNLPEDLQDAGTIIPYVIRNIS